mgnify:CR=1 FL=1
MDAIEALRTRRSIRAYESRPVDRELVETIVDCGRLAATARNVQPCAFVAVSDADVRARIAALATNGPFIATTPVCIAVLSEDSTYYLEDGCAATQNMLVAARALGLGTCWVAGDKKPYAKAVAELVGAPANYKLVALIALGYPASTPAPAKRPLSDVLHWEQF